MELNLVLGSHGGVGRTEFAMILSAAIRRPYKSLLMVDFEDYSDGLYCSMEKAWKIDKSLNLDEYKEYIYFKIPNIPLYVIRRTHSGNVIANPADYMNHLQYIIEQTDLNTGHTPFACVADCPLTLSNLHQEGLEAILNEQLQFGNRISDKIKLHRIVLWFVVDLFYLSNVEARRILSALDGLHKSLPSFLPQHDMKLVIQRVAHKDDHFERLQTLKPSLTGFSFIDFSKLFTSLSRISSYVESEESQKRQVDDVLKAMELEYRENDIRRPGNILPLAKIAELEPSNLGLEGDGFDTVKLYHRFFNDYVKEVNLFV